MNNLHLMKVYVAVAEEQGFSAAARRLSMSPPAVTRAVAALEEDLGVTLRHPFRLRDSAGGKKDRGERPAPAHRWQPAPRVPATRFAAHGAPGCPPGANFQRGYRRGSARANDRSCNPGPLAPVRQGGGGGAAGPGF